MLIYNTLSRQKEVFVPIIPQYVKLYVCGMTVYDDCHVGHARVMVVFDLLRRWLEASGYEVCYVRNITDIDDKIIRRAAELNESMETLTQRVTERMHADAAQLGVLPPTHEPRATHYIPEMRSLIERLQQQGLAYQADDGDVNFSVRQFPSYGRLSGKSLDDLRAGERVNVADSKRDPLDFVLWKQAKEGEPFWDSPWGAGRPGWHIECSAMSCALLGEHFDIHGGGADLQFPHHENEIAQSVGAHQSPFVNYWMHNGFVRVDNEKMSKSLGNFFTIRDVLARYNPEVVRLFILRAHYRSPLNYSDAHLDETRNRLRGFYTALKDKIIPTETNIAWNDPQHPLYNPFVVPFTHALDDDLNTPEAFAVLSQLSTHIHTAKTPELASVAATLLRQLGGILGLLQQEPQQFLQQGLGDESVNDNDINKLIEQRTLAKKNRQFSEADRIRDELKAQGVVLEDTPQGTSWRRL